MKTLEMIKNELAGKTFLVEDFENEIISIFEDYEFEGENEIMVTTDDNRKFQAYANKEDAPIIIINTELDENEDNEEVLTITNAYIY